MLLYLIENNKPLDEVIYFNTGMDFQSIYNIRDRVIPMLKERNINFVELHPDRPFLHDMFEKPVTSKNGSVHYGYSWCGGLTRWMTRNKIRIINKYYNKYKDEDIVQYIGIAADERERESKEVSDNPRITKKFPLIEANMTEADCLKFCYDRGFTWDEDNGCGQTVRLYDILDRCSCWCCQNKNLKELEGICKYLPNYWEALKELQAKTDRPMKKCGSVFELEDRFKKQQKES